MWYLSIKKAQRHRFISTLIAEEKGWKGALCSMNFNMELIGFKAVIITKVEKISGQMALYWALPKKAPICPSCLNNTTKIHDDRIQKIKQLKLFERLTIL